MRLACCPEFLDMPFFKAFHSFNVSHVSKWFSANTVKVNLQKLQTSPTQGIHHADGYEFTFLKVTLDSCDNAVVNVD